MPLYAQKDRGYISEMIATTVEDSLLGKQIAQELMRRDYSIYDAEDYTIYSKGGDGFPAEEIVDMLSEKNLEQLTLDKWIALYRQATAVQEQKEAVYKAPVEERIPHAIPYTDIEVSLGVPWISREIIGDFIDHILVKHKGCACYVRYEPVTGNWSIRDKKNLGSGNTNAGSSKCLDLLHKVRHVQGTNGGRGVVFATGTPLCNSISDAYAMQLYLQYEELEKTHLDVFDNWVKTFALPEQLCEIDVDTSKFRFVRKFSNLANYRMDRITNIRLLDTPVKPVREVEGMKNGLYLPKHMAEHLYMFSGESIPVTFRMKKIIMNDVIDWFGSDITFSDETEDEVGALYERLRL